MCVHTKTQPRTQRRTSKHRQSAWRVSHAERNERRAEREEAGEEDSEEDETPVVIPSSAVTMHPKGTPAPTSSVEVQVFEERVDLSNDMTWRQMIGVGVRNVVLARGALDKLEGPKYAVRRAELRRAARARERQAAPLQDEARRGERRDRGRSDKRENDESGTTARWHEGCSENRRGTAKGDRKRQTTKG